MISITPMTLQRMDPEALAAHVAALEAHSRTHEERIGLLEEENRWLKAQLFGRSSEKSAIEDISPDQTWLFKAPYGQIMCSAAWCVKCNVAIRRHSSTWWGGAARAGAPLAAA